MWPPLIPGSADRWMNGGGKKRHGKRQPGGKDMVRAQQGALAITQRRRQTGQRSRTSIREEAHHWSPLGSQSKRLKNEALRKGRTDFVYRATDRTTPPKVTHLHTKGQANASLPLWKKSRRHKRRERTLVAGVHHRCPLVVLPSASLSGSLRATFQDVRLVNERDGSSVGASPRNNLDHRCIGVQPPNANPNPPTHHRRPGRRCEARGRRHACERDRDVLHVLALPVSEDHHGG